MMQFILFLMTACCAVHTFADPFLNMSVSVRSTGRELSTVELVLGVYGPITSISTTSLATAVAFDLDFRKNFDSSLVARFGQPIIAIPNLNVNLRIKVQIGTSNSETDKGVATALDFFLPRNGLSKVAGVVGGYHSAISMPVASLAAVLKIPQVSWGSTSPALSNKGTYPFFSRTIPPDSIQGKGMWQFIVHFQVPTFSFIYAAEPYGEGLYSTVNSLAQAANQAYRVTAVAILYMPSFYNLTIARDKVNTLKTNSARIVLMAMTSDQATKLASVMEQEGLFSSSWQLIGSEGVKIAAGISPAPTNGFPFGFVRFNPISQGPLFPNFQQMWLALTANDITGPAAVSRYSLDKFQVLLANGQAPVPTASMFNSMAAFQLEDPFVFDACYAFAIAFNELLNSGSPASAISGQTLLDKVRAVNFNGISGTVAFDANGDRLASYTIDNIQPTSPGSSTQALITVGEFSAVSSQITLSAGILWMTGTTNSTLPSALVACPAGNYEEAITKLCRLCAPGTFSLGGVGAACTNCAAGKYAAAASGATGCIDCGVGNFSVSGSVTCDRCPIGRYANATGLPSCLVCPTGKYQNAVGQTQCMFRQIQLGMYGPMTSLSMTFLASAIAFDIDFRKNFEPSLVSRFGPPIVTISNLNPNLRTNVQIGNSNSDTPVGVGTALDMFMGRNGLQAVAGLVGGYHSAISMPIAGTSATLNVPQVAWGSTSPALSNKGQYPYFSRTMSPDSIQGAGMWQFIVHFNVPSITFLYAQEAYGQGLFNTVDQLAAAANQAYRVNGVGVDYMPTNYNISKARDKLQVAKVMGSKILFLAMTADQATRFLYAMELENMLTSAWQIIGSEAVKLSSATPAPTNGLPVGYLMFNPISRGSLFPHFEAMWKKMTPADVIGPGAISRYSLDKWQVNLTSGSAPLPTASMFATLDAYQLEDPFMFDAGYAFIVAFNEMMNDGTDPINIKGQALLDKVRAVTFEGISGPVSFDSNGDRLSSYTLDNYQKSYSSSSSSFVTVGVFSSATSQITLQPQLVIQWMDGTNGTNFPSSLTACVPGFGAALGGNTGLCYACAAGHASPGGAGAACTRCLFGTAANAPTAATNCTKCLPGTHAAKGGLTSCDMCDVGRYAANDHATSCTPCEQGRYADSKGQANCTSCLANQNTLLLGATGRSECKCEKGFYRSNASHPCMGCKEGMTCPYGSDMSEYWTWHNAQRPATRQEIFPTLNPRYSSLPSDPLDVFACKEENRCPGGPPGTCGPQLRLDIISCARCNDEWYWDGEKCASCTSFEASSVLFPLIPLMITPVVICLIYRCFRDDVDKWGSWQNGCAAIVFMLLNHFQIVTLAASANLNFPKNVNEYFKFWSFSDDFLSLFKPQCAGFQDFQKRTIVRTFIPIDVFLVCILTYLVSHLVKKISKIDVGMNFDRTLNIYFSLILTFFAGIVSSCLTLFKCHDNPNGKRTLSKDESIICGESTWKSLLVFAIFACFFYIFGFGSLFVRSILIAPSRLTDVSFQRRWKFLFIKFRPDAWWWSVAFCLKSTLMNIGYTFLETGVAQLNWIAGVTGAYLGFAIYYMPWRHRGANLTEIYVHLTLLFVLSWLTWFAHDAIGTNSNQVGDQLSIVLVIVNASTIASGVMIMLHFLLRAHGIGPHPDPAKQLTAKVERSYEAVQAIGQLSLQEYDKFVHMITEWDQWDLFKAMDIVLMELMGLKVTWRSTPKLGSELGARLTSKVSNDAIEVKSELVQQSEPVIPQVVEKIVYVKQDTDVEDRDIPADSHGTPRCNNMNARFLCTPRGTLEVATPRSWQATPHLSPGGAASPRDTPRVTPRGGDTPRMTPRAGTPRDNT